MEKRTVIVRGVFRGVRSTVLWDEGVPPVKAGQIRIDSAFVHKYQVFCGAAPIVKLNDAIIGGREIDFLPPFLFSGPVVYYVMNLYVKGGTPLDNIILIGMPGSGKSTIGVLLAKRLGYQFLDVDLLIQEREGALLQEILDTRGTAAFLDAEEKAVLSLDCRHTVIAPGGSAVCRDQAARHLSRMGTMVYLNVSLDELTHRIQNLSSRGIAMEPGQTLADVLAYRDPLYRRYAGLIIDCPRRQLLDETAQRVLAALRERGLPH